MGHLGEAVPVPLVLSEPHTLGAGVSTVCGVAVGPRRVLIIDYRLSKLVCSKRA